MPAPDPRRLLALRVAGEQARVMDLFTMLESAAEKQEPVVVERFRTRIERRRRWAASVGPDEAGWQEWSDGAQDADLLVDELVTLLMTQLLRSNGLDLGTFAAAESLLAELVERGGLPKLLLGHTQEMESLDHSRAKVSIRFPGSRIWDVPFLTHEFGHHATQHLANVEPTLRHKRPLAELSTMVGHALTTTGTRAERAANHAEELLADCVATAASGPAYPLACLYLRVPRGEQAKSLSRTHPSWRDRVAVMREVLDALTEGTGEGRHRRQRETVVDPLAAALLGDLPIAGAAGSEAAHQSVARLLEHAPQLVYREADIAIEVADRLRLGKTEPPVGATIRSVLDGAWRWRDSQRSREGDPAAAALAVAYCHTIAKPLTRTEDDR